MNTLTTDDNWSFETDGDTVWVKELNTGGIVKIKRLGETLSAAIWDSDEEKCINYVTVKNESLKRRDFQPVVWHRIEEVVGWNLYQSTIHLADGTTWVLDQTIPPISLIGGQFDKKQPGYWKQVDGPRCIEVATIEYDLEKPR